MEGMIVWTRNRVGIVLVLGLLFIGVGTTFKNYYYAADSGRTFYVSPDGNDSNPGTIDKPLLTLAKAQLVVRPYRFGNVTVFFRGGVYPMTKQVKFWGSDSGKAGSPVVYKAYPGEKPIFRGSVSIDKFSPLSGNIVVADLNTLGQGSLNVTQLFMNGALQIPARVPNFLSPDFNAPDPHAGNYLYTTGVGANPKRDFRFNTSQLDTRNWTNVSAMEVVIYPSSIGRNDTIKISSINQTTGTISLASDTALDIAVGSRFYVQRVFQQLDSPGEWYFDAPAKKVYFYPPRALTGDDRISVPVSSSLLAADSAQYIEFRGLTFEENLEQAIVLGTTKYFVVADCEIRNSEKIGIGIYSNQSNTTIERNIVHETGDTGIYLWQDTPYYKSLTSTNTVIANNRVFRNAQLRNAGVGISVMSIGVTIAHNEVYDQPHIGIVYRGNDNIVEYNYVHNVNQLIGDSGGIYIWDQSWIRRGNIVRNNLVKETGGYSLTDQGWRFNRFTWGIYLDDFSSGNKVYNNIVIRPAVGGFQVHSGRDNELYNNIVVEAKATTQNTFQGIFLEKTDTDEKMWVELRDMAANGYDRAKYFAKYPELSTITGNLTNDNVFANNRYHHNIVYFPGSQTDLFWVRMLVQAPNNYFNDNLYWSGGRALTVYDPEGGSRGAVKGRYSWDKWKSFGFDTRSVIADPQFVDPGSDNYDLKSSSPAFGLGFQPIDQSKIGIERVSKLIPDDSTPGTSYNSISSSNSALSNSRIVGKKPTNKSSGGNSASVSSQPNVTSELLLENGDETLHKAWYDKVRDRVFGFLSYIYGLIGKIIRWLIP